MLSPAPTLALALTPSPDPGQVRHTLRGRCRLPGALRRLTRPLTLTLTLTLTRHCVYQQYTLYDPYPYPYPYP